jgi:Asp/Glu/hydantoin racemase
MIGDMAQQSHSRYVAQDGADVLIMGCAGMARHRRPLEDALGVPVIDPTQAAVAMAIGTVQAGLWASSETSIVRQSEIRPIPFAIRDQRSARRAASFRS